jgi:hypothetical protein
LRGFHDSSTTLCRDLINVNEPFGVRIVSHDDKVKDD